MPRIKAIVRNMKLRLKITRKKDGKRTRKERGQFGKKGKVVSGGGKMRKPDGEEKVVEGDAKYRGLKEEAMGGVVEFGRCYSNEGAKVVQPPGGVLDEGTWEHREDAREELRYGDDMHLLSSPWSQGESNSASDDGRKSDKPGPAEKKRGVLLGPGGCRAEETELSWSEEDPKTENLGGFRVESVGNQEQYMVELSRRPYPSISADILVIRVPNATQRAVSGSKAGQSTEGTHPLPERRTTEQYPKEETNTPKDGLFRRERFSLAMVPLLWSSDQNLKDLKTPTRNRTSHQSQRWKKRKEEVAQARLAALFQQHSEREELELGRISSENILFGGNNVSSDVSTPLSLLDTGESWLASGGQDSQLVQCPEKHQGQEWQMGWMIGELGSSQRDPYWLLQDDVTPYVRRLYNSDNEVLGRHGDTVPFQRCIRRVRGCQNLSSMM